MNRRKAFTMPELLAAMVLLGAVATFAMTFQIDLMRLAERHAGWSALTEKSFQLARLVRTDAKGARRVDVRGATLLIERRDGVHVRYEFADGKLRRIFRNNEDGTKGYWVPCGKVEWEISEGGRLLRGELVLTAKGSSRVISSLPFAILASTATEGEL